MSVRDYKETKEEFLRKLAEEAKIVRGRVSGYSRRERENLLKLARKVLDQKKS